MMPETREMGSGVLFALREELDRWLGSVRGGNGNWSPSTDMYMDEGELFIEVELPGVEACDVEILNEGHELTIRALSSDAKTPKGATMTERRRGTYERKLMIPSDMNAVAANADLKDGVLTLRIPRAVESEGARRIELGRSAVGSTPSPAPVAHNPGSSVPTGAQPLTPTNGNGAPKPNPAFLVPSVIGGPAEKEEKKG